MPAGKGPPPYPSSFEDPSKPERLDAPTIRSAETSEAGCECGRPFPLRVYFFDPTMPHHFIPQCTFLITCRCGRTYPCASDGVGVPTPRINR